MLKQLRHQNSNVAKNAKLMKINFPVTKPSLHLVHKRFKLHVYIPRADISTQSWYMLGRAFCVYSGFDAYTTRTQHVLTIVRRKKAKLYFFPSTAFNLIFAKKKIIIYYLMFVSCERRWHFFLLPFFSLLKYQKWYKIHSASGGKHAFE